MFDVRKAIEVCEELWFHLSLLKHQNLSTVMGILGELYVYERLQNLKDQGILDFELRGGLLTSYDIEVISKTKMKKQLEVRLATRRNRIRKEYAKDADRWEYQWNRDGDYHVIVRVGLPNTMEKRKIFFLIDNSKIRFSGPRGGKTVPLSNLPDWVQILDRSDESTSISNRQKIAKGQKDEWERLSEILTD
ncbi:MAG: hypothetical protein ACFFER_06465 [Candidatus Thorarchaeota archaeon]